MKKLLALALLCASLRADTAFVSSVVGGSTRADTTAWVGYKITVAGASVAVTALGRFCQAGNSATHTIDLTSAAGTVLATATVNMAGCSTGAFIYAAASVSLVAGTTYYILSAELLGGDTWQDCCIANIAHTAVATVPTAAYSLTVPPANPASITDNGGVADSGYVPVGFTYSTGGGAVTPRLLTLGVGGE